MSEIKIRQALAKDIDQLLVFEQAVIQAELPFDPTLKREPTRYYDLDYMLSSPDVELLVAELENKLVGSGYARIEVSKAYLQHERHAYLGFMYVVPEHRGKGINKQIITALQAWAVSRSVPELRLDVYFNNSSAIRAYEKIGFSRHMLAMRFNPNDGRK